MGLVLVVAVDVAADEALELFAVPDDGVVEEFSADRSDTAFSERVRHRSPHWCLEDLEAFGLEDLVEGIDEPAATVSKERPGTFEAFAVADEQFPGGLGGLLAGWVGGDAGEETSRVFTLMKNKT